MEHDSGRPLIGRGSKEGCDTRPLSNPSRFGRPTGDLPSFPSPPGSIPDEYEAHGVEPTKIEPVGGAPYDWSLPPVFFK